MYCPMCGTKIEKIKWKKEQIYQPMESSEIKCKECELTIFIVDNRSHDQEGTIEIILH